MMYCFEIHSFNVEKFSPTRTEVMSMNGNKYIFACQGESRSHREFFVQVANFMRFLGINFYLPFVNRYRGIS